MFLRIFPPKTIQFSFFLYLFFISLNVFAMTPTKTPPSLKFQSALAWIKNAKNEEFNALPSELQEYTYSLYQLASRFHIFSPDSTIFHNPSRALCHAAERGFSDAIGDLVNLGADINVEWQGRYYAVTPLILAAGKTCASMINHQKHLLFVESTLENVKSAIFITKLLEYDAIVDKEDSKCHLTALKHAIIYNNIEAAAALINGGANVNLPGSSVGYTPLHTAVERNASISIINFLVAHGADLTLTNNAGVTPLVIAQSSHNKEYAKILEPLTAAQLAQRIAH